VKHIKPEFGHQIALKLNVFVNTEIPPPPYFRFKNLSSDFFFKYLNTQLGMSGRNLDPLQSDLCNTEFVREFRISNRVLKSGDREGEQYERFFLFVVIT
jgi:hypothetical protein